MLNNIIAFKPVSRPSNFIDGRRIAASALNGRTNRLQMRSWLAGLISLLPDNAVQDALEICTIETTYRTNRHGKNNIPQS